jgi:hypothetical protein
MGGRRLVITQSRLSTEFVQVDVGVTTEAGTPGDPSGDVVQMAFARPGALPADGDWHTAAWVSTSAGWAAQVLVGPQNGGIVLAPGPWVRFVKVTDSPEIPVRSVPGLTIS